MIRRIKDLKIGSKIIIPGFQYNGKDIELIKATNDSHYDKNQTIFVSKEVLSEKPFDAKEPQNPSKYIKDFGNNNYSLSNIRQWLNSDQKNWFKKTHEYDEPPNSNNVIKNPYDNENGFLYGIPKEILDFIPNTNILSYNDKYETQCIQDKIFLISNTEVGFEDDFIEKEGKVFPLFSEQDDCVSYWLRTPQYEREDRVRRVNDEGKKGWSNAAQGHNGIRIALSLFSNSFVYEENNQVYLITNKNAIIDKNNTQKINLEESSKIDINLLIASHDIHTDCDFKCSINNKEITLFKFAHNSHITDINESIIYNNGSFYFQDTYIGSLNNQENVLSYWVEFKSSSTKKYEIEFNINYDYTLSFDKDIYKIESNNILQQDIIVNGPLNKKGTVLAKYKDKIIKTLDVIYNKTYTLRLDASDINDSEYIDLHIIDNIYNAKQSKILYKKIHEFNFYIHSNKDMGCKSKAFKIPFYIDTFENNEEYNISVYLNNEKIKEINNYLGNYSDKINISQNVFNKLEEGKHYVEIKIFNENNEKRSKILFYKKLQFEKTQKIVKLNDFKGNELILKDYTLSKTTKSNVRNTPIPIVANNNDNSKENSIFINNKKLFFKHNNKDYKLTIKYSKKNNYKKPKPPVLYSRSTSHIKLHYENNYEYSINLKDWKTKPVFNNLKTNTKYYCFKRIKETDNHNSSYISYPLIIRTEKKEQNPPSAPKISNITSYSLVAESGEDTMVSIDKKTWYDSPFLFKDLKGDTIYNVYAKAIGNDLYKESEPSEPAQAKTLKQVIYGVVIDEKNANPNTRVRYTDSSSNFHPIESRDEKVDMGDWEETFIYKAFRPCVVKDGSVQYYLDKNDFTKKEDGTSSNLTGEDGDVMIEIGKMWLYLNSHEDHNFIKISNYPAKNFQCFSHTLNNREYDYVYIGSFLSSYKDNKIMSISDKTPAIQKNIKNFREDVRKKGSNYNLCSFYLITLIQSITTIMTKTTDSQLRLGPGYTQASALNKTGSTSKYGMFYSNSKQDSMCFMGIEDLWGNARWWIDGFMFNNGYIETSTSDFNDKNTYKQVSSKFNFPPSGLIKTVSCDNLSGLMPTSTGGSSSTYYADRAALSDNRVLNFGGSYHNNANAGIFSFHADTESHISNTVSSRIMLHKNKELLK